MSVVEESEMTIGTFCRVVRSLSTFAGSGQSRVTLGFFMDRENYHTVDLSLSSTGAAIVSLSSGIIRRVAMEGDVSFSSTDEVKEVYLFERPPKIKVERCMHAIEIMMDEKQRLSRDTVPECCSQVDILHCTVQEYVAARVLKRWSWVSDAESPSILEMQDWRPLPLSQTEFDVPIVARMRDAHERTRSSPSPPLRPPRATSHNDGQASHAGLHHAPSLSHSLSANQRHSATTLPASGCPSASTSAANDEQFSELLRILGIVEPPPIETNQIVAEPPPSVASGSWARAPLSDFAHSAVEEPSFLPMLPSTPWREGEDGYEEVVLAEGSIFGADGGRKTSLPSPSFEPNECVVCPNYPNGALFIVDYFCCEANAYALFHPATIERIRLSAWDLQLCSPAEQHFMDWVMHHRATYRFRRYDMVQVLPSSGAPSFPCVVKDIRNEKIYATPVGGGPLIMVDPHNLRMIRWS